MQSFKDKVIYQIYPKSFADTTGNGFGDLKGITEHLDYVKSLGADMIWLNPIYPSPMVDNGYDISDYRATNPEFGTMEDFEELVREAKKRGIGIMLDMVFNHTSTEHEWFQKALQGDPEYMDYYIFEDPKENGDMPTHWESKFGGPVWEYVPSLNKYYLHLFDPKQADLNWKNPKVREECADVIRFWMDKGVEGFRFDVINLIDKPDEWKEDENGDGRFLYTDGPRVHEYLKELNRNSFGQAEPASVTVGEMSSTTLDNCKRYASEKEHELDMVFSFHHLKVDYKNQEKWNLKPFDFLELKRLLFDWQCAMQEADSWNTLFWECHDQPRSLSRFGDEKNYPKESAKLLAGALFLMRGTPYFLQGEELGVTNNHFHSLDQYRDVESLNAAEILKNDGKSEQEILEILDARSRDNGRSPMYWDASEKAGFTAGKPWMDINPNHVSMNVASEEADPDSVLNFYRKLFALRKEMPVLQEGKIIPLLRDDPQILAYKRALDGKQVLVLANFYKDPVRIPEEIQSEIKQAHLLLSNYQQAAEHSHLRPYELLVFGL